MTIASITFAATAGTVSAIQSRGAVTEVFTTSGVNQTTTAEATADRPIVRIATDTAIFASFGAAPNAGTDETKVFIPANSIEYLAITPGDKAAIINA